MSSLVEVIYQVGVEQSAGGTQVSSAGAAVYTVQCMEVPVPLLALLGLRRGLHMFFLSTPQLPCLNSEHDPPIYAIRVPSGA